MLFLTTSNYEKEIFSKTLVFFEITIVSYAYLIGANSSVDIKPSPSFLNIICIFNDFKLRYSILPLSPKTS